MDFLLEVALTWVHIVVGLTMFLTAVIPINAFLRRYNEYMDRKEMKSEMDRLRDAMKFTKEDMENRR